MNESVRFSITGLFGHPPQDVLRIAIHAEALGFHSVWIGEHALAPAAVASSYPYGQQKPMDGAREEIADPFAIAAAIAASTTKLRIVTAICILPLYHPVLAARAATTVQRLASGRFDFGVGVGWAAEEYEALQIPFKERGARLDEGIEVLRKAMSGGAFEHRGRHYSFPALSLLNRPLPISILVGGTSEAALMRAARLGDGWCASADQSVEQCAERRIRIEAHRRELGRSEQPFQYYVRLPRLTRGGVEGFSAAGFHDICIGGPNLMQREDSLNKKLKAIEQAATELGLQGVR